MNESADPSSTPDSQALLEALEGVLLPLARLAVGRGLHFAAVEERLKTAFVQAAREANPGGLPHRQVSRISTTTGINRREVTRLVNSQLTPSRTPRSHAGALYAHWLTDPIYRDVHGQPLELPRQGAEPSFETLARSVTSDVHPRSLLAEMERLGLARVVDDGAQVQLVRDALVPRGDLPRSLRILGDNVGSHLSGAVANVLGDGRQHFDQAIVANGLSEASLVTLRKLIQGQWRQTFDTLVPAIERMVEADQARDDPAEARQRMLIGLYSFNQAEPVAEPAPEAATPRATTRRAKGESS